MTTWTLIGRKTATGSNNAITIGNHNLYLVVVSMSSGSQLLMPMVIPKAALSSVTRYIAVYGESGDYHVYLTMSLTTVYVAASSVSGFTFGYIEVYGQ